MSTEPWDDAPPPGLPVGELFETIRAAEALPADDRRRPVPEPELTPELVAGAAIARANLAAQEAEVTRSLTPDEEVDYLAIVEAERERLGLATLAETLEVIDPLSDRRYTPSRTAAQLHTLAHEPDILARFAAEMASIGVAGEIHVAKLVYLVVTSRFLDRIVSLAVKGPSAGGKSFLVQTVIKYFPPSAYHALTAMSERNLAYDQEPLQHRILVIYEAEGMAGDMQSYFIRSLLSEGMIRYAFVEKTKAGLNSRLIEREGPTGLIVTTTAVRLHPENETRLLSITVSDTPDQTRAVLHALAGGTGREGDVGPWHELQEWLAEGPTDVDVPYARALAEAIPPVAVRLRRDFSTLLSLIRAHALLHRATREIVNGEIVATIVDYAAVRELVVDLVSDAVELTVPESVRETVEKVGYLTLNGGETSIARIAAALGLDRSSTTRRVKASIERGYVKNIEEKRGLPSRLALGDPLPDEVTILPTADELGGCAGVQ
jgi:hypothetical protein